MNVHMFSLGWACFPSGWAYFLLILLAVDGEGFDRTADGSPQRAYDAIQKLQSRLVGERARGKGRVLAYDEVQPIRNLRMLISKPYLLN